MPRWARSPAAGASSRPTLFPIGWSRRWFASTATRGAAWSRLVWFSTVALTGYELGWWRRAARSARAAGLLRLALTLTSWPDGGSRKASPSPRSLLGLAVRLQRSPISSVRPGCWSNAGGGGHPSLTRPCCEALRRRATHTVAGRPTSGLLRRPGPRWPARRRRCASPAATPARPPAPAGAAQGAVRELYVGRGLSTAEIAAQVGGGTTRVTAALNRYGIPLRPASRRRVPRLAIDAATLTDLYVARWLDDTRSAPVSGSRPGG